MSLPPPPSATHTATAPPAATPAATLAQWLRTCSFEVTPLTAERTESFSALLPPKTRIFVTHLPDQPFRHTVDTVLRLRREGMIGVAHIAARNLKNTQELEEGLSILSSSSHPSHLLILGGSRPSPSAFSSTMDIIATGLFDKDTHHIYFAGHPEGSPDMSQDSILKALEEKNTWAAKHPLVTCSLVTQFCFTSEPIFSWIQHLHTTGNRLPLHIGIPGIATMKTLYRHAKACGIGNSMRFLTQNIQKIALLSSQPTPDELIHDLARNATSSSHTPPHNPIAGFHLYPFGGLPKTLSWREDFLKNLQQ